MVLQNYSRLILILVIIFFFIIAISPEQFSNLPDTNHLEKTVIEDLKTKLFEDYRNIDEEFAILVDKTLEYFEGSEVTVQKLVDLITNSSYHSDLSMKAGSLRDLFKKLAMDRYLSFFVLQFFIKRYGNSGLKGCMNDYLAAFNRYCERKVSQVPTVITKSGEKGYTLHVKLSQRIDHTTVTEIKKFQDKLQETFGRKLFLQGVEVGSIVLILLSHSEIPPLSHEQGFQLHNMGVLRVSTDYRVLYKELIMNKVTVPMRVIRFNYIGFPGSGKTYFHRRLMGKIVNQLHPGTVGVAERVSAKVWSGGLREEAGMICQFLLQVHGSVFASGNSPPFIEEFYPSKMRASEVAIGKSTQASETGSSASLSLPFSDTFDPTLGEVPIARVTEAEIDHIISEAMKAEDSERVKFLLDDMALLVNTEIGFDPTLLELQTSLIKGPSFNLFFSRLVDELDQQLVLTRYTEDGMSTSEVSDTTFEEFLLQLLSCIAGSSDDGDQPEQTAMFVGTHCDMVTREQFARKDKLLQDIIKGTTFYRNGMVKFASQDQLMFAVDNHLGDRDEIDRIRNRLEGVIQKNFQKIEIPASWLVLNLLIRWKNVRTMSVKS